jgi:hypothetical protein
MSRITTRNSPGVRAASAFGRNSFDTASQSRPFSVVSK